MTTGACGAAGWGAVVVALSMSAASVASAQPSWTVGPETDPFLPAVAPRDDGAGFYHPGGPLARGGIAVVGGERGTLLRLGEDGRPLGPELALAARVGALGRTIYFDYAGASGCELRHYDDPAAVDACPLPNDVLATIGDAFVFDVDGLTYWAGPPTTALVTTRVEGGCAPGASSCRPSVTCHDDACAVQMRDEVRGAIYEIDPRVGGSLGTPVLVPMSPYARVWAIDDGWVVEDVAPASSVPARPFVTFYDRAWTPGLSFDGSVRDCAGPGCLVLVTDATAQWYARPSGLEELPVPFTMPLVVCTSEVCFGPTSISATTTFAGVELASGTIFTLAEGLWLSAGTSEAVVAGYVDGHAWLQAGLRAPAVLARVELGRPPVEPVADVLPFGAVPSRVGWLALGADGRFRFFDPTLVETAVDPTSACVGSPYLLMPGEDGWWVVCGDFGRSVWTVIEVGERGAVRGLIDPQVGEPPITLSVVAGRALVSTMRTWQIVGPDLAAPIALPWTDFARVLNGAGRWMRVGATTTAITVEPVDRDGRSSARTTVATDSGALDALVGGFDGTYFLVLWGDGARSSGDRGARYHLARFDVEGALVGEPIVVAGPGRAPFGRASQGIVSDGNGHSYAYYERQVDEDLAYEALRVRVRAITTGDALGTSCVDGDACGSGLCVGGVCCSRACDGACETCSAAEGAERDGICGMRARCESDAGVDGGVDAGIDAGGSDASVDAGGDASVIDAGGDASAIDASMVDAWPSDARRPDAASDVDASDGRVSLGGCGCRAGRGDSSGLAWWGVALVAWAARRRRAR